MTRAQQLGRDAETRATRFLTGHGLTLVTRNYRCRGGEIDLVMRDGRQLVFVEVRYRSHSGYGGALASIDPRKRRRLIIAAQHYLLHSGWQGPCRFDVVGFGPDQPAHWIRDAIAS